MSGEQVAQPEAVVAEIVDVVGSRELKFEEPREDTLQIDLGNLLAFDPRPLSLSTFKSQDATDTHVMELGRVSIQALADKVFNLPSIPEKVGRLVDLPPPTMPLPREKPLPKPRPPTKWEKFAQTKGIVKRKRSKMEWDEGVGDWRRRHGYKRLNDDNDEVIVEAKAGDDPSVDPFSSKKADKKARVAKQEKNQLQNLKEAAKKGGRSSLPSTVQMSAAKLPLFGSKGAMTKPGKEDVGQAASMAGIATASIGKFDKKRKDEKPLKNTGKRRKFLPVVEGTGQNGKEKNFIEGIMNRVIAKNDHDVMDINKAVKSYVRDEEEKRRESNAGNDKGKAKGKKRGRADGNKKGGKGGKGGKKR